MNDFKRRTCLIVMLSMANWSDNVWAEDEFAFRPELDLAGPLGENLSWGAKLETTFRPGEQDSWALLGRVSWKPLEFLSVTPEIFYAKQGADAEWRPRLSIEGKTNRGPVNYALRGRFEYRIRSGQNSFWRYRLRLKATFPKIAGAKPFIFDEIFYEDGDRNSLNANEAGVGVGIPIAHQVNLVTELRAISSRSDDRWQDPDINLLMTFEVRY